MPGISPFTQSILRMAWGQLFDASGPFYLPDVLREGAPDRGIAPLEPLHYAGPSPAVAVDAPEDVRDSACASPGVDPNPIAVSIPLLHIKDVRMRGVYALHSAEGELAFSDTDPELTATLTSGTFRGKAVPLQMDAEGEANYSFAIDCCVPVSDESRECGPTRWTADATGKFTAAVRAATVRMTLRIDFPVRREPPVITVVRIEVAIDQSKIDLDFGVEGLDEDFVALADSAVQQGVAGGIVQTTIQAYLDSPDVRASLGSILTQQFAQAMRKTS